MKTILLWDPRFPERHPARLTLEDTVASAAVRSGVATAANPAEAGALSAGGALDPGMMTEVVLQHGFGSLTRRVFLPYSVVMVGAAAGVLASIGTPIAGGATPPLSDIPKYPNFPSTTRQIRQDSDIVSRSSGIYPVAFVPSTDFIDGRNVLSMIVNGANAYNQGAIRGAFPTAIDMSNGNLALWLKRMTSGDCQVEIDLYSSGSPTSVPANYHTLNMYTGFLNFTLDPGKDATTPGVFGKVGNRTSRFAVVGTGANLAAITHYQIRLGDKSGSAFSVQVSDLVFTPNPRTKAAIIPRMDDAWKDVYTGLKPMWESKGLTQMPFLLSPGAVASTSGIDGPASNNRLTSAQVNEMRTRGWQVGTQALTTENAQANYAAYMTEYNGMMQYYRDRGWISDAASFTYYSNVNMGTPNARAAMVEAGARTCQRFVNGSQTTPSFARNETFPPIDQMQMLAMNLNGFSPNLNATPARSITSQLMAQVDRVVAENGVLIVAGHQDMFQNTPEYEALQALVDRFINVGDFEFHTEKSLLDPYLVQYGPAPTYAAAYSGKA